MSKIINLKGKFFPVVGRALRWHFRHYLLRKDSPLMATLLLTNRCNLKCKMCNLWKDPKKNTLAPKVFKQAIDDLSLLGCAYVSFGGGEPMVVEDLFSYLSYAAARIPFVNMVTNGQQLDSRAARELAKTKMDMVSISIDGLRETHDEIRGIPGSFEKAIGAIENLKRYAPGIGITVNTVISPWNVDELLELSDLIEDLGVLHKFQPIFHHPVFEGQVIQDADWQMTAPKIERLREIVRVLRRRKSVANSAYFLSSISTHFTSENRGRLFKERCKSVHFYCEVREDGRLFVCTEGMSWKGGFSLFDHTLKEVYYSLDYRKTAKRLRDCKRCQKVLPICYMEPRIAFPVTSFIKYTVIPSLFS